MDTMVTLCAIQDHTWLQSLQIIKRHWISDSACCTDVPVRHLSVCLLHSCTLLKLLPGTLVCPQVTLH